MIAANKEDLDSSEKALRADQVRSTRNKFWYFSIYVFLQDRICAWLEEVVDDFDPPTSDLLDGIPKDIGLRKGPPAKYMEPGKAPNKVPEKILMASSEGHKSKMSRVDLYQKLLDIYNGEKFRWVQFKNDARPRDFSKQAEVDAYDRKSTASSICWPLLNFP